MIPLGKRERGVYLVEAVGGDLRAYTVVVVTDLAMVEKAIAERRACWSMQSIARAARREQTRESRSLKHVTRSPAAERTAKESFSTKIPQTRKTKMPIEDTRQQ